MLWWRAEKCLLGSISHCGAGQDYKTLIIPTYLKLTVTVVHFGWQLYEDMLFFFFFIYKSSSGNQRHLLMTPCQKVSEVSWCKVTVTAGIKYLFLLPRLLSVCSTFILLESSGWLIIEHVLGRKMEERKNILSSLILSLKFTRVFFFSGTSVTAII